MAARGAFLRKEDLAPKVNLVSPELVNNSAKLLKLRALFSGTFVTILPGTNSNKHFLRTIIEAYLPNRITQSGNYASEITLTQDCNFLEIGRPT